MRPRVLVAANLRALETMHRILGRDLEVIPALSSKATLHGPERKVHMVIVEHSRMLLLLEALSSKRAPKDVPIVCCRNAGQRASGAGDQIERAVQALADVTSVDLSAVSEDEFRSLVLARLRSP